MESLVASTRVHRPLKAAAIGGSTIAAVFLFLASSLHAQGIQYSAPQGYSTFPFTNTSCTGAAQNSATLTNNNQTEHYITLTTSGGVTGIRATVQGSHDGVTWNDISDVATQSGSIVMGQGYFPMNRIQVTCASAVGTFTVQYSGEATAPAPQIGAMISSQADKTIAAAVTANANFTSQTIRAPFGNSGGSLYFLYSAAGPSGSILGVSCTTLAIGTGTTVASFPLSTSTAPQFFPVPLLPCDFITVTYTSGGASAATFTASYIFNPITITGGDPCQGATAPKKSVAINQAAAGTQQLVAGLTGHVVYVCGYNFTLTAGAATTAQLEYGTNANCAAGTTALSGAWVGSSSLTITPTHIIAGGGYAVTSTPSGDFLCIVVTGATTPNAQGILTYVQQ
jgi:hypothetical protein